MPSSTPSRPTRTPTILPASGSPVAQALDRAARRRPHGWAVRDATADVSFPALRELAEREAAELARLGVRPGSRLLLHAVPRIGYLVSYVAALRAGCLVMPWEPAAGAGEAAREIARHRVEFVLRPSDEPATQAAADRLTRTGLPAPGGVAAGPAVLLATSGTGGLPKRTIHREARLLANARAHALSVGLSADDVALVTLSPAFSYCHTAQVLAWLATAGRLVLAPRPALPHTIGQLVADHGVSTVTTVPHQLGEAMVRALARGARLRQLVVGGSAVTGELVARVRSRLPGAELVHTWGMTEAGPRLTTWRAGRDGHRPGSVGLPVAGVRVVAGAPDGRVPLAGVPAHCRVLPGELVVRTPYLMAGYLDAGAATRDVVLAEGVLRTGDLGRVDPGGYVFVTGRVKNLIDVAGQKVSPEEIESVLVRVPGVAEARVAGEADAHRGERPVAQVVLDPVRPADLASINRTVRERLAKHKWPTRIDIVDSLDRTVTGKVRR